MNRHRLPDRRSHTVVEFEHAGHRYRAGFGHYPDGRTAELFLDGMKVGTDADSNARDCAVAVSIALQFGAPLDVLRKALCRDASGNATGPVGAALDRLAND